MPIYEYRCDKGHVLEVMQRMSDDSVSACTECGAPVQRVFHPVAVHFKGSGFYNTDYGKAKNNKGSKDGKADSSESGSGSDSKSDSSSSSDSKSSDKSDSKTSKASASSSSDS
ncbi:MAG TPA: FmdB family zinc ribbon protein [Thermoleophilaceae bacterium]|nr:FmdB family zinc ribbon protein [Thermoleophilaceae bacterium]